MYACAVVGVMSSEPVSESASTIMWFSKPRKCQKEVATSLHKIIL